MQLFAATDRNSDCRAIAFNLPYDEFNTIPELRVAALALSNNELEIVMKYAELARTLHPETDDESKSTFCDQLFDAAHQEMSRRTGEYA